MSSEQVATDVVAGTSGEAPAPEPSSRRRIAPRWLLLIAGVIVVDILAFIAFPQTPKGGAAGDACSFPACFIENSLEFPAAHNVIDLAPGTPILATDLP